MIRQHNSNDISGQKTWFTNENQMGSMLIRKHKQFYSWVMQCCLNEDFKACIFYIFIMITFIIGIHRVLGPSGQLL